MTTLAYLGLVFFIAGAILILVAALGALKLPDIYCRAHALGKAMTLGLIFSILGYGFSIPEPPWLKLLAILLFQLVTIPVASHLFCLAAYRRGVGVSSSKIARR